MPNLGESQSWNSLRFIARLTATMYTYGMIQVTESISINEDEIQEEFVRSSGPGGQNVNKVSTAVRLRFSIESPSLPGPVQERLKSLAHNRISEAGILIIDAHRFRTQAANREDALDRLVGLIRQAAEEPKIHRRTRPTLGSKERRLQAKHHRSDTKQTRRVIPDSNDG
jgi:ribosome-associated protein